LDHPGDAHCCALCLGDRPDAGSQYTGLIFTARLSADDIDASIGSRRVGQRAGGIGDRCTRPSWSYNAQRLLHRLIGSAPPNESKPT